MSEFKEAIIPEDSVTIKNECYTKPDQIAFAVTQTTHSRGLGTRRTAS